MKIKLLTELVEYLNFTTTPQTINNTAKKNLNKEVTQQNALINNKKFTVYGTIYKTKKHCSRQYVYH